MKVSLKQIRKDLLDKHPELKKIALSTISNTLKRKLHYSYKKAS